LIVTNGVIDGQAHKPRLRQSGVPAAEMPPPKVRCYSATVTPCSMAFRSVLALIVRAARVAVQIRVSLDHLVTAQRIRKSAGRWCCISTRRLHEGLHDRGA
jgi:hypothetical protein